MPFASTSNLRITPGLCFSVLITLLFSMPCLSATTTPSTTRWKTHCKLADHQEQDQTLSPSSPYTYYLCTSTDSESQKSQSYTLAIEPMVTNTIITWPGTIPLPENYNVVALGNPQSNEFAMIEENEIQVPKDTLVAAALQARELTSHSGPPTVSTFRYKSADQELLEKFRKSIDKELQKKQAPRLREDIKQKVPMADYIFRHWHDITRAAQSIINYVVLAWPVITFGSVLWDESLRTRVATFEDDPDHDFKDCPVRVLVDTNEFLGDMHRQGVTSRQFTSLNTIREISEGFDSKVTTFQTTGRFIDFVNQACQCPSCPGESQPRPHSFGDCLVDVIIQTDAMVFDALRLTNSDLNDFLNAEVPLSGYIARFNGSTPQAKTLVFDIKSNTTLNTATVLYANFSNFDTLLGSDTTSCRCPACPPVQTNASKNAGIIVVGIVNLGITFVAGVTLWATVLIISKAYRQIKA